MLQSKSDRRTPAYRLDGLALYGDFVNEVIVQQTWGRNDIHIPMNALVLSIIYICTVCDKTTMDKLQYYHCTKGGLDLKK